MSLFVFTGLVHSESGMVCLGSFFKEEFTVQFLKYFPFNECLTIGGKAYKINMYTVSILTRRTEFEQRILLSGQRKMYLKEFEGRIRAVYY